MPSLPSLTITSLDVEAYFTLHDDFSGSDTRSIRSFYSNSGISLYGIFWRGAPIAVFCVNIGPMFRCIEGLKSPAAGRASLGAVDDCVELAAIAFSPQIRGTWLSAVSWALIVRAALRTGQRRLIFFAVAPYVQALYESCGYRPIFSEDAVYLNHSKTFILYAASTRTVPIHFVYGITARFIRHLLGHPLCGVSHAGSPAARG